MMAEGISVQGDIQDQFGVGIKTDVQASSSLS